MGTYFAGINLNKPVGKRLDPTVDFDWSFKAPQADFPNMNFSVRWSGFVYAPISGTYTFRALTDDGMRVWVGDGKKAIIDEWRPQPPLLATGQVALKAGQYYPIRIEYFQIDRVGKATLGWVLPGDPLPGEDQTAIVPISPGYLFAARPAVAPRTPSSVSPAPAPAPARPVPAVANRATRPPAPVRPGRVARVATTAPPVRPAASLDNLNTLARGTVVTMQNLYFVQSTAIVRVESLPELDKLAAGLKSANYVRLEIAGHTDAVGDSVKNYLLSQQRAGVVRDYLVKHGIDSTRLTTRGYGGSRPIADNQDPAQRPRNRRVEVIIR